jgi:hypothetical protein
VLEAGSFDYAMKKATRDARRPPLVTPEPEVIDLVLDDSDHFVKKKSSMRCFQIVGMTLSLG